MFSQNDCDENKLLLALIDVIVGWMFISWKFTSLLLRSLVLLAFHNAYGHNCTSEFKKATCIWRRAKMPILVITLFVYFNV